MMLIKYCQNSNGQTVVEYSLLIGIVIAVLLTLTPMVKRSTQGVVKIVADEVGYQNNAEQKAGPGLMATRVQTRLDKQQNRREFSDAFGHSVKTGYDEVTITDTVSKSDLGAVDE